MFYPVADLVSGLFVGFDASVDLHRESAVEVCCQADHAHWQVEIVGKALDAFHTPAWPVPQVADHFPHIGPTYQPSSSPGGSRAVDHAGELSRL